MLLTTGLLLASALLLLVLYFQRRFSYWSDRGVYSPKPRLLVGNCLNLFLLKRSPGQFLWDIHQHAPNQPLVGFYVFDRPAVLIRSPELLRSVLVKDFASFADRYNNSDEKSDPLGSRNLFVIRGAEWKYLREKLSPTFTSGKMRAMFPLVVRCDQQLVDYMRSSVQHGVAEFDMKEVTARCTTDVISNCAFGIDSNSLADPKAEFRELGKKTFEYNVTRSLETVVFFFAPYLVRLLRCTYFQKDANDFLRGAFWETLTAREKATEAGAPRRNDLIDHLIQLKNKGAIQADADDDAEDAGEALAADKPDLRHKFDFSGDDLVAHAVIFFVAGFESTASTMSFCLYELSLQPTLQERLRKEIAEHLQQTGGQITYDMVHSMRYLDMVICETLRKYPPLPFLDRECLRDYPVPGLQGCVIQRGTPVYVSLLGLHMDPQNFPQPDAFDPERFRDKSAIRPFTYMPFGNGPHNCIGMRFGLMSSKAGVVSVLSQFEVLPSPATPVPLEMASRGVILSSAGGINLKFRHAPLIDTSR